MIIKEIPEYNLSKETVGDIAQLLQRSFEGYPSGQVFFQQLPSFRLLGMDGDELMAHMSVIHRVIASGGEPFRIFGIGDLCVKKENQHSGLGSSLISHLQDLAKKRGIDFLMLVSESNNFYVKHGFEVAENTCCWLMMQNNRSLGLVRRKLEGGFMYKEVGSKKWPEGEIDLLGHVF